MTTASTTLTNTTDSAKFQKILNTFNSTFLKTIKNDGGLLSEIDTINKVPNNLNIPIDSNITNTYSIVQFANFIRNIVNFNIVNYDSITTTTDTNMVHVKKTTVNNVNTYTFNDNVKNHTIETLKVINVFVDILEAYKYCIDNELLNSDSFISGYTNEIIIDHIELVSNTTRFYTAPGTGMYPGPEIKNIGYIRPIIESDDSRKNVLYLSIESFYTGMRIPYNYNNMFSKSRIDTLSASVDIINENILEKYDKSTSIEESRIQKKNYSRQIYSGIEDKNLQINNLTLEQRNKNLIVYLLKILLNLELNFRKQCVRALYYYYKFVQLYSTFIINVSNVMYTNALVSSMPRHSIDTLNMSLMNMPKAVASMSRVVSGIQIKTPGNGYSNPPTITISGGGGVGKSAPSGGNMAAAAVTATGATKDILLESAITISRRGTGYVNTPTIAFPTPANSGTIVNAANLQQAVASITIVPIAIADNQKSHDENIQTLMNIITDISTSINTMNNDFTLFATNESDIEIIITTVNNSSEADKTNVSLSNDNNVLITIKKDSIRTDILKLMNKDDIINNYMVHDKINKFSYSILKIIENVADIKIILNAIYIIDDLPEDNINTKIFKSNTNAEIAKPVLTSDNVEYSLISNLSAKDFLIIKKKDLNTYKNEYINNRDDIAKLNENIKINLNKVENQKNLYNTHYNKNLFLTRQIISYNTIIAVIILILIVINMLNVDPLFIKTVSLVCLGIVLLLFAVYFISNITYIEAFAVTATTLSLNTLKPANFNTVNIWNPSPTTNATEYNTQKKIILTNEISELNKKFIGFFEKLIITLPTSDNVDFYKEVTGIITNDKDSKIYTNNVLLINKDDATNNIDLLKYEMENNKLYIMSLLIATIVFISIYNMYINYVSNDRFLSLTVFICVIILIIIASYYVIRSNRRVRTFYKNIYWGPETSTRF